jgi:putative acetyltransferase
MTLSIDHPFLKLRLARNEDGDGMGRLIARIFSDYENCPFLPHEFQELGAPADHYRGKKKGELWILEDPRADSAFPVAGSIAITPTYHPTRFELFKIYLAHEFRGSGLSQMMLNNALDYARAHHASEIMLWTDTRFHAGHRFYEKAGFVRVAGIRQLHDAAETFEFGYRIALTPPKGS